MLCVMFLAWKVPRMEAGKGKGKEISPAKARARESDARGTHGRGSCSGLSASVRGGPDEDPGVILWWCVGVAE